MRIGVPKEIKNNENRVAITPAGVATLTAAGHEVYLESGAGTGSGFSDESYAATGANILAAAADVWSTADMILKVKEPLPSEYGYFREGLILFTYLHLAAAPELAAALLEKKVIGIAYETVEVNHTLPLLTPMSEVAGRMAVQIGAQFLERPHGGKGILLSGVPGVKRGKVTVIGGGVVGTNAAKVAAGMGADVTIIDLSPDRLRQLDDIFGSSVQTLMSNPYNIAEAVAASDLVIGAVLIPGAKAPKLVTEDMVKSMEAHSVIVDVAIDQGGIVETIDRITTHNDPTYEKHGVVHYAVANMPGAVPKTSTMALTNATMPYVSLIANLGLRAALERSDALKLGVNTAAGTMTYAAVARDLGYTHVPVEQALERTFAAMS
ncbi:alanine dehydrogenase [Paenibacillus hunanensis]|uniref:Alanine dehydrogenase n=1 Tax=Paenibacillus hunanensis TaxID=539262 RepID=A0ABU1IXA2_9BACL|nr:alanine dehydrogenase [Paenibacillus hunanensis]MCL9661227.1 alanine dehydrogenase [Paenibacillus hunanensis]MDR6243799.1 alanine dehydrogenase [Paenibacillus hunanensis]GGJ24920.1 alanine dehydrogenase [Paenibacillus hunanensis]